MPAIEEALRAIISGDAPLWALLGGRLWAQVPPESARFPVVVLYRISSERVRSLGGPSGLAKPTFQFACYANEATGFAKVRDIANRLRVLLDGYRGEVAGVRIWGITLEDERESSEEAENSIFYRVDLDFRVMHRED